MKINKKKFLSKTDFTYKNICKVLVFFCSVFVLFCGVFSIYNNSIADGGYGEDDSAVSISISETDLNIEVEPEPNGTLATGELVVSVSTTSDNGYTLYSTIDSQSTNLEQFGGDNFIPMTDNILPNELAKDTWGYNPIARARNFMKIPESNNPEPIVVTNEQSANDETVITIGANVSQSVPAGYYSNSIIFTVISNDPDNSRVCEYYEGLYFGESGEVVGYEQYIKECVVQISDDFVNNQTWVAGRYDGLELVDEDYYVSMDSFFEIATDYHSFSFPGEYRIELNEYDSDLNYMGKVDIGMNDYYFRSSNAAYFSVSLYQYEYGDFIENDNLLDDANNNLEITMNIIDDLESVSAIAPGVGSYFHNGSLLNTANWRLGSIRYYRDLNATDIFSVSEASTYGSLRNVYIVEQKTYTLNINDTRVRLAIFEFDANGRFISTTTQPNGTANLQNGFEWTPHSNTKYVAINARNPSADTVSQYFMRLFDYGLKVQLLDEAYQDHPTIEYSDFDFGNYDGWIKGAYHASNGKYKVDPNFISADSYLNMTNMPNEYEYIIKLPSWNLRMTIVEIDVNGDVVKSTVFENAQTWIKDDATVKIAVSVRGSTLSEDSGLTYDDYKELYYDNGQGFYLNPVLPYDYNTEMTEMSAFEFVEYMNVGWNLGNSLDSYYKNPDLADSDYRREGGYPNQEKLFDNPIVTEELLEFVADQGFNTIRIPTTWYYNTYIDENGEVQIYDFWLKRVQQVVNYAIKNDVFVILNTHHEAIWFDLDATTEEEFQGDCENARRLWTLIATHFRDYDEHLIFEAYNELSNGSWTYSEQGTARMNVMNQVFVDAVRATGGNNEKRLLSTQTLTSQSQTRSLADFVLPQDDIGGNDKIIVQVHNYWSMFDQDVEAFFTRLEDFSNDIGAPVIVGEFGPNYQYEPTEYRVKATSNYVARGANHGVKCIYWDNGKMKTVTAFGVVNRKDFSQSRFDLIDALINPVAYKTDVNNKIVLDSIDDFIPGLNRLNTETAEIETWTSWGGLVAEIDLSNYNITSSHNYLAANIALFGEADVNNIHRVYFYDENKEILYKTGYNLGYSARNILIPAGAAYIRVAIYDSYRKTTLAQYENYLSSGQMRVVLTYVNSSDPNSLVPDI